MTDREMTGQELATMAEVFVERVDGCWVSLWSEKRQVMQASRSAVPPVDSKDRPHFGFVPEAAEIEVDKWPKL